MGNRVACDAVNSGGDVDLLDAVDSSQVLGGYLAWSCLFLSSYRCKRKSTSCPNPQYATDDSLLPHAKADERVAIALFFEELHHHDVVGERGRRRHDLVEIDGVFLHLLERLVQLLGGVVVVEREDQSCASP